LNLYVVRHAVAHKRDADRWPDDAKRPLTPEGEEQFQGAAGGIVRLVPEVDSVLSSHFVRAWRTAEILEQRGWPAPISCAALEPNQPPYKVLEALERCAAAKSVAIVGHRPQLHELVSCLVGDDPSGVGIRIKKGGMVRLSFDGLPKPEAGYLEWVLTPRALQAIS
jgi:phosphohistidine phosphatase